MRLLFMCSIFAQTIHSSGMGIYVCYRSILSHYRHTAYKHYFKMSLFHLFTSSESTFPYPQLAIEPPPPPPPQPQAAPVVPARAQPLRVRVQVPEMIVLGPGEVHPGTTALYVSIYIQLHAMLCMASH